MAVALKKSSIPTVEKAQAVVHSTPAEVQADVPEPTTAHPTSPVDIIEEVLKDIQVEEVPAELILVDQIAAPMQEVDQTAEAASAPTEEVNQADIPAEEEPANISNEEFDS